MNYRVLPLSQDRKAALDKGFLKVFGKSPERYFPRPWQNGDLRQLYRPSAGPGAARLRTQFFGSA